MPSASILDWQPFVERSKSRAVTCSLEWQQPFVHQADVQVFWSGNNNRDWKSYCWLRYAASLCLDMFWFVTAAE
jgi:hypothetical protein